jgi:multidrug efflux system membrane fusion protein
MKNFLARHRLLFLVILILIIAAAVVLFASAWSKRKAQRQAQVMGPRPQPVTAVAVEKTDLDVYLKALGTVIPLNTVTVRPQVGGQLIHLYFREGQTVAKGDVLAQIDPRPFQVQVMQAEGQLAKDEELLHNAEVELARYKVLLAQDSIAVQQVTAQESLVKQYKSVIQADKGQLASARLQLSYSRIVAPISGLVGLKLVDPGNIVAANETSSIAVITQLQPITVVFSVPQDNLPAILKRFRSVAIMPVIAFDQDGKTILAKGKLLAVDNQIDTATGTIKLKAAFKNEHNPLFPNQFVNIRLRVDTLEDAAVMSTSAVQRGSIGTFAYVVGKDQVVSVRSVKLGPVQGDRIAVTEGLEPGEMVVTTGGDKLREGSKVFIISRDRDGKTAPGASGRKQKEPAAK